MYLFCEYNYKLHTKSIRTQYILSDISETEISCEQRMNSWKDGFLLRILTPLPLLCDVDWQSYGSLSGLRSIFKSCKAPHSISIFSSVMVLLLQLFKFDLRPTRIPITQSKQHRRVMKEVSKCAEENCAFHAFIQFSHHISVFYNLTICKCTELQILLTFFAV